MILQKVILIENPENNLLLPIPGCWWKFDLALQVSTSHNIKYSNYHSPLLSCKFPQTSMVTSCGLSRYTLMMSLDYEITHVSLIKLYKTHSPHTLPAIGWQRDWDFVTLKCNLG